MGIFGWLGDMLSGGAPSKERYDKWIDELKIKKRDWEEMIDDRKSKVPPNIWSKIQGWSDEEIKKAKLKLKYGEGKVKLPDGLLLNHLNVAGEILNFKERMAETQRQIDNIIRERAKNHEQELQPA